MRRRSARYRQQGDEAPRARQRSEHCDAQGRVRGAGRQDHLRATRREMWQENVKIVRRLYDMARDKHRWNALSASPPDTGLVSEDSEFLPAPEVEGPVA